MNKEEQYIMTEKQTIEKLINALYVATDRAVSNGDRLIEIGQADINRGQFLSLVRSAVKEAENWIDVPDYYYFNKFK